MTMAATPATAALPDLPGRSGLPPWTCPFCPLLCDTFQVAPDPVAGSLTLQGSDCVVAAQALSRFGAAPSSASPAIGGDACTLDHALAAAARTLAAARQPLFGGLGTDVAGARGLYRLACRTGAISDAAGGTALQHGISALQDRGGYTTTLAEVRTRADLIVCIGGLPTARYPEFLNRCGIGEGGVPGRHLVVVDAADALAGLPRDVHGVAVERVPFDGDLYGSVARLAALVDGRSLDGDAAAAVADDEAAASSLPALARALHAARYAVVVWSSAGLPAQGALVIEMLNRIVGVLNRRGRAAALALGGGEGAATVSGVYTWLSGLPLRSRAGPRGLEHEPHCYDAARLLGGQGADALLWVASFGTEPPPPAAAAGLPLVLLGHPRHAAHAEATGAVFIPVSTPGIGSAGHLFRTDGSLMLPLSAVRADRLPTLADVVRRLDATVAELRDVGEPGTAALAA